MHRFCFGDDLFFAQNSISIFYGVIEIAVISDADWFLAFQGRSRSIGDKDRELLESTFRFWRKTDANGGAQDQNGRILPADSG